MWQPIETAPRDQTFLAVLDCAGEQTVCTMRWPVVEAKNSRPDGNCFHVERVTHWMPLPDLPGAHPSPSIPAVDALAQFIREIDGAHRLCAGVLAEHIVAWLAAAPEAKPCP